MVPPIDRVPPEILDEIIYYSIIARASADTEHYKHGVKRSLRLKLVSSKS